MIYDGLNYSHVVYTCKFCNKKWDFTSRFFTGSTLACLARFLLVVHCVIHHTKEVKLKNILNGLKCGLLAPIFCTRNNFDCDTSDCSLSFISSFNFFVL